MQFVASAMEGNGSGEIADSMTDMDHNAIDEEMLAYLVKQAVVEQTKHHKKYEMFFIWVFMCSCFIALAIIRKQRKERHLKVDVDDEVEETENLTYMKRQCSPRCQKEHCDPASEYCPAFSKHVENVQVLNYLSSLSGKFQQVLDEGHSNVHRKKHPHLHVNAAPSPRPKTAVSKQRTPVSRNCLRWLTTSF
eukprot:304794-Hanusia_phi.AAC.2